jgi:dTDP-glucose pyrophosphorylase
MMNPDIQSLLIGRKKDLQHAMKQLEVTEKKILFVIDKEQRLYGTLTDGDIRRWIMKGGGLQQTVDRLCNKKPYFIHYGYKSEQVRNDMLQMGILSIPVVNEKQEIVEVLFWDNIFADGITNKHVKTLDVPVVIMAGGKGTRLDPFTKILPKPLIPIGDKTVIEIIIDSFLTWGIRNFFVTVNHKSKIIKSYFEELSPPYAIEYVDEDIPLGTAGSLRFLLSRLKDAFIVTNCDVIIKTDCVDLLDFHQKSGNDITLVASIKNYNIPYGICKIKNGGTLTSIREKPEYSFLVNTGMYVLNPGSLKSIPEGECFHMTQLIEAVKSSGGRVGVFPISEDSWFDTGEWAEYKKALEKFSL